MMNMFSSFDPSSFFTPFCFSLFIPVFFFKMFKSKMKIFMNLGLKKINSEILPNLSSKNQNSSVKNFISLFFMLAIINISGLVPSSFSITSQMSFNFSMSIFLWISTNIFSITNKKELFIQHMVPNGSPMVLAPFMVMIEVVSNIIRPITLSVRLTANMVAGHILISLMENFIINFNPNLFLNFFMASILMILETGVALVQAYVFSILTTLYFSENH